MRSFPLPRFSQCVTPWVLRSRLRSGLLATGAALLLGGCASQQIESYAAERPALDLKTYFDGRLVAHGMFQDRSGQVVRRFVVEMTGTWQGNHGMLDERFTYSDGKTERRVWRLIDDGNGHYRGTADDVVGEASGQVRGNAFNWRYTLRLPVDGQVYEVQFDDWMYRIDERVVLNRAEMRKFGIRLGEVTLAFTRLTP
ncbi:DUF3833 domain-containing protein [Tepidimonas sp.]|uniref:DUF3833 domain-containing protein n=1 Tax=Tepidimonas sp. TaxID=2002775 RepID=UPI003919A8EC